jgi:hypothetical protein
MTRIHIMSVPSDLPDVDAAAQRLLQNQVDIGNVVKSFYRDQAGKQLTSLLNEHILIAAAKAGDTAKVEDANQRWYENADQRQPF